MLSREHLDGQLVALAKDAKEAAARLGGHKDEDLPPATLAEAYLAVGKLRQKLAKLTAGLNGHASGKE